MVEAHNVPLSNDIEPLKPQLTFLEELNETRITAARIIDAKDARISTSAIFKDDCYQLYPVCNAKPTKEFPYVVEYRHTSDGQEIHKRIVSVQLAFQRVMKS